eukprot:6204302-Pleurochrysis_carterae.AAC.1
MLDCHATRIGVCKACGNHGAAVTSAPLLPICFDLVPLAITFFGAAAALPTKEGMQRAARRHPARRTSDVAPGHETHAFAPTTRRRRCMLINGNRTQIRWRLGPLIAVGF